MDLDDPLYYLTKVLLPRAYRQIFEGSKVESGLIHSLIVGPLNLHPPMNIEMIPIEALFHLSALQ